MARYIDPSKIKLTGLTFEDINNEVYFSLTDVRKAIEQTPTADVVEVKHGFWTAHPASYECSICGNEFFVEGYAEDYDAVEDFDLYFCPNCGTKMDGERKEQK